METILKEILSQMQTMSTQIKTFEGNTNKRFIHLEESTNKRFTKLEIKIENEVSEKIQALYEDRDIIHNKLDNMASDISEIKEIVTEHDMKIKILSNKNAL